MSRIVFVLPVLLLLAPPLQAQNVSEHLDPLAPFVGKTWRGEFAGSTKEAPMIDVSKWEWALNGQAIRILHSLNEGAYGGETMIMWDAEEESFVGHYFTTSGFMTRSTIDVAEDGRFTSHEYVTGHEGGITEVEATAEVTEDGTLISKSRYLRNGCGRTGTKLRTARTRRRASSSGM